MNKTSLHISNSPTMKLIVPYKKPSKVTRPNNVVNVGNLDLMQRIVLFKPCCASPLKLFLPTAVVDRFDFLV